MDAHLIPFYDNWTFLRTELGVEPDGLQKLESSFRPVELPHDWLIYNAKDLYQDGCGWYRKSFELEEAPVPGERLIVRFEGVYMDSTVYVNGKKIGDWR